MTRRLAVSLLLAVAAPPLGARAQTPDAGSPRDRFMASLTACAHLPSPADTVAADPALRRELLAMAAADQADREFTRTMGASAPPDSLLRRMTANDSARTGRLRQIVRERGWPRAADAGRDGANAAFLVLQHAPDAVFQALMLPEVEAAYRRGELEGQAVAMLTDRVRAAAGLRQRYGMQPQLRDGRYIVGDDVEDPEGLAARRAEMCLLPMDLYLMLMEEMYGLRDHGLGLFRGTPAPRAYPSRCTDEPPQPTHRPLMRIVPLILIVVLTPAGLLAPDGTEVGPVGEDESALERFGELYVPP